MSECPGTKVGVKREHRNPVPKILRKILHTNSEKILKKYSSKLVKKSQKKRFPEAKSLFPTMPVDTERHIHSFSEKISISHDGH